MAFMNPNVVEKKFATGFEIDLTGTATKELSNATMSFLLAVLTICIPYLCFPRGLLRRDSSGILDVLMGSWRDLTAFACAQIVEEMSKFREARIKRIFVTIAHQLEVCKQTLMSLVGNALAWA